MRSRCKGISLRQEGQLLVNKSKCAGRGGGEVMCVCGNWRMDVGEVVQEVQRIPESLVFSVR